jgi:hydrogenase expression/formation protein HypE
VARARGRATWCCCRARIGDHGVAVLSQRESLEFETAIVSDTAALHGLVARCWPPCPKARCARCATPRAAAWPPRSTRSRASRPWACCSTRRPSPSSRRSSAACELLGLDPLYIANEGKLIAIVAPDAADAALAALRAHPLGRAAARIGAVQADEQHFVQMATRFGGRRVVDWLSGEPAAAHLLMKILLLTHAFNGLAQRLCRAARGRARG